jgi:hypothetical protein
MPLFTNPLAAHALALPFHGNTMNFYPAAMRFLSLVTDMYGLRPASLSTAASHATLSSRGGRMPVGGALQLAREAVEGNCCAAHGLAPPIPPARRPARA